MREQGEAPAAEGLELELEIRGLAAGGDGVGRSDDGRVVFVPLAAPGDRLRVRVRETRPRYLRAEILAVERPGPGRVEPRCPVFGRCGGCSWQHLDASVQLAAKAEILRDALRRIGHLDAPGPIRVQPSPEPYGYRQRARLLARGGRVGYRARRSHGLCAVEACPVLTKRLDERLQTLARRRVTPGEWELAEGVEGVRALRLPARRGQRLSLEVGGDRVGFSAGVFAQSNAHLNGALAAAVQERAGRGRIALELYCGSGFLTLGLARRFERVVALESSRAALRDLEANARAAGLDGVEPLAGSLEQALAAGDLARVARGGLDALVLDPPRSGLPGDGAAGLAALGARRIVYLSCHPASWARDLAALVSRGYALREALGFDLFPQTPHVEALALLEAEPGAIGA